MATRIADTIPQVPTLAAAFNALKLQIGAGAFFHLDASEGGTGLAGVANASDLPTSLTLANAIMNVYLFHLSDSLAHKIADPPPALVVATDLTSAQTLANAIKADHNTHIASTTYHYSADATNTIAAANATDQTSLNTLLNELKTDLAAHIASAPSAPSLRVVAP